MICLLVVKVYVEVVWFVVCGDMVVFIGYVGYEEIEGMFGVVLWLILLV